MVLVLLQEETTGLAGAADDAKKVAEDVAEQPISIFTGLREFLQDVYDYVLGPDFVGNILASLLVAFLGVLIFRVLTRGVPRILQWRRRNRESLLDEEAVARVKRQDTAI